MRQGIYCCRMCELWQFWKTHATNGKFDRICAKCATRHRTKIDRRPGVGGRPRNFTLLESPPHRPKVSIRNELQARNNRTDAIRRQETTFQSLNTGGFVSASILQDEQDEALR